MKSKEGNKVLILGKDKIKQFKYPDYSRFHKLKTPKNENSIIKTMKSDQKVKIAGGSQRGRDIGKIKSTNYTSRSSSKYFSEQTTPIMKREMIAHQQDKNRMLSPNLVNGYKINLFDMASPKLKQITFIKENKNIKKSTENDKKSSSKQLKNINKTSTTNTANTTSNSVSVKIKKNNFVNKCKQVKANYLQSKVQVHISDSNQRERKAITQNKEYNTHFLNEIEEINAKLVKGKTKNDEDEPNLNLTLYDKFNLPKSESLLINLQPCPYFIKSVSHDNYISNTEFIKNKYKGLIEEYFSEV